MRRSARRQRRPQRHELIMNHAHLHTFESYMFDLSLLTLTQSDPFVLAAWLVVAVPCCCAPLSVR